MNIKTLTVDGVEYEISSFGEQVQRLSALYETWSKDLEQEKLAVAKTETALNVVNKELAVLVQAELESRKAQNAEPAAE